ncbi:MAG: hypothetical protein RMM53_04180 [Bacteroidia bacterium]|nr:hypothetical protein [Bacteroidia bacterium]MDW8333395.1 hypothetical protein [Bacteroidia bacterium]
MIIKVPQTTFASFEIEKFWVMVNEKKAVELLTCGLVGTEQNPVELFTDEASALEYQIEKDARTRSFLVIEIDPSNLDVSKISASHEGKQFSYRSTIGLQAFGKVSSFTREVAKKEPKPKATSGGRRRKAQASA